MLNKEKLNNLAGELWKGAKKLRGKFKAYEYQAVILPMIMIRRIECMLIQKRKEIEDELKKANPKITDAELKKKVKQREILTVPYYNKTDWTLTKILKDDATQVETHFRQYLTGFSDIINEIIDEFNYRETISKMVKANRLDSIIDLVDDEDFSTQRLSNIEMGYVYEELLQRFTQDDAKDTGEHFTPREIIRIMVELMEIDFNPKTAKQAISIYDPACGTGGMLSTAKEHLMDKAKTEAEQQNVQTLVQLFGQEYLGQNYAVCKTDLLLRGDLDGSNKDNITKGNSLIPDIESSKEPGDKHYGRQFDYMISNPPFGVNWSDYKDDALKFIGTRYKSGIPSVDDGALLFLLSMIEKMKPKKNGGSKIAILFNESPLNNGDASQGESEIRRFILENDFLDTVLMLPNQMFYNTSINTYIWLLNNNKKEKKKNKVLVINARNQFDKEPKSFGNKRNRITKENKDWIMQQFQAWEDTEYSKVFDIYDFAFHKVEVIFWQEDELSNKIWIEEEFDVQLNNQNVNKRFELYGDMTFDITLKLDSETYKTVSFHFDGKKSFEALLTENLKKVVPLLKEMSHREILSWYKSKDSSVQYKHRYYIVDFEYIPFSKHAKDKMAYINEYLLNELDYEIISWKEVGNLGYEIIPNNYFYVHAEPQKSQDILKKIKNMREKVGEAFNILSKI